MKHFAILICLFGVILRIHAQGFINLNFEQATIVAQPSGYGYNYGTATCPGWSAYVSGYDFPFLFNTQGLDGSSVTLYGTNSPYAPTLQGKYSVYLKAGTKWAPSSAAISQTGQIPTTALSLTYWGASWNSLQITFNGQLLSFLSISNTPDYTIYGADISPYAGQTGELLFTAPAFVYYQDGYGPVGGGGFIDNIRFSSTSVPEPGELALAALGTLLLSFRRWQNSAR